MLNKNLAYNFKMYINTIDILKACTREITFAVLLKFLKIKI